MTVLGFAGLAALVFLLLPFIAMVVAASFLGWGILFAAVADVLRKRDEPRAP